MMDKELTTFFLAFENQPVTITVNMTANSMAETEGGIAQESFPIFYEGILMDYDKDYYYLGNGIEISQAVKINNVVHIISMEQTDPYSEFLDSMPVPDDNNGIN